MDLGRRIQELRRERGLSQEGLAEQMGVSRQAISKWESGAAIPEVDKLIQLARFFGVTVDGLLGVRPPESPRQEDAGEGPAAPGEGETPPPPPGLEERLHALEGMVAALGEERQQRRQQRKWTMYLPLGVMVPALVLILWVSVYNARNTQWRLRGLEVDLSQMNYEIINLKYKDNTVPKPTPEEEAANQLLADWDISFQGYDLEERTLASLLSATPKSLREGMTAEFVLTRKDGIAVSLPAQAAGGAVFQAEAHIPWEGETAVSISLLDVATGERTLCRLATLQSPGDSLRLHAISLYQGTTSVSQGKVAFRGVVQWECWYHGGEIGIPVKNYAVSARAAVYIDGEEAAAFPFDLGRPEDQGTFLDLSRSLEGEYPLAPGQRLELVMESTDALGQQYREVLAVYAADESGAIAPVE